MTLRYRRQVIRDYWESGAFDELEKDLLLDCLSDEQRSSLGRIQPSFMGGEYLPGYAEGELEIVRVELESTTSEVISVRARKTGDRIEYSIYDEYETEFDVSPQSSVRPLTLEQLIGLIDKAGGSDSLALCYTIMNYSGTAWRISIESNPSRALSLYSTPKLICTTKKLSISGTKKRKGKS